MTQLFERVETYHLETMSHYFTPSMLFEFKMNTVSCFGQCNHIIWYNIFKRVRFLLPLQLVHDIIQSDQNRISMECRHDLMDILEGLIKAGYIPQPLFNSNDFHIYEGNCSSHWVYTPFLPSSQLMRHYWRHIMQLEHDISRSHKLYHILQRIILCLPGVHVKCVSCLWYVPECEIHDQSVCTFCVDCSSKRIVRKKSVKSFRSTVYKKKRNMNLTRIGD